MTQSRVVLVTGAAGPWGGRVAERLGAEPGVHVVGVDRKRPAAPIAGLDLIQVDIRYGAIADLLRAEGVEVVCHLDWVDTVRPQEEAYDRNVRGTAALLAACAEAGVGKFVWKSSMHVYGALPTHAAFLTEDRPLRGNRGWGTVRDLLEVEALCSAFRLRAPQMAMAVLRFASIVGPTVDSPLTRFLERPWRPSLWGYDPRLQVIHEEDVIGALAWAALHDAQGAFNVAAEGVLTLNRARGLAGKLPVMAAHHLAYRAAALLGGDGLRLAQVSPAELDYLRYAWVGDLARMHQVLGFTPRYSAQEALREFAEMRGARALWPSARRALAEKRMDDVVALRQRGPEEAQDE